MPNPNPYEPVYMRMKDADDQQVEVAGMIQSAPDGDFAGRIKLFGDNAYGLPGTTFEEVVNWEGGIPHMQGRLQRNDIHLMNCQVWQVNHSHLDVTTLQFEFATVGDTHGPAFGGADEPCITIIAFELEGLTVALFHEFSLMRQIKAQRAREQGHEPTPETLTIEALNTPVGSVKLTHKEGVESVQVNIAWTSPATLTDAWDRMNQVADFVGVVMGNPPKREHIGVLVTDEDGQSGMFRVYGPAKVLGEREQEPSRGALISPHHAPEHFADVMTKWLAKNQDPDWRAATDRVMFSLQGSRGFLEDRLVAGANTFEHIPDAEKPPRDACGKRSLVTIIKHRAKVVRNNSNLKNALPMLEKTIQQACRCRIGDSHSSRANEDKSVADFTDKWNLSYLTKTLEFVYVASLMLDCGWDPESGNRHVHPLGNYVVDAETSRRLYRRLMGLPVRSAGERPARYTAEEVRSSLNEPPNTKRIELDAGVVGENVIVDVPDGDRLTVTMKPGSDGARGSIVVTGDGDGDAIRVGSGLGNAVRAGAGHGNAVRRGGAGDAERRGNGDGDATYEGQDKGTAKRLGTGQGHAYVNGREIDSKSDMANG